MKIVFCDNCGCLTRSRVKYIKQEIYVLNGEKIPVRLVPYRYCKECGSYIYDPKFDDKLTKRANKKSKYTPVYFGIDLSEDN